MSSSLFVFDNKKENIIRRPEEDYYYYYYYNNCIERTDDDHRDSTSKRRRRRQVVISSIAFVAILLLVLVSSPQAVEGITSGQGDSSSSAGGASSTIRTTWQQQQQQQQQQQLHSNNNNNHHHRQPPPPPPPPLPIWSDSQRLQGRINEGFERPFLSDEAIIHSYYFREQLHRLLNDLRQVQPAHDPSLTTSSSSSSSSFTPGPPQLWLNPSYAQQQQQHEFQRDDPSVLSTSVPPGTEKGLEDLRQEIRHLQNVVNKLLLRQEEQQEQQQDYRARQTSSSSSSDIHHHLTAAPNKVGDDDDHDEDTADQMKLGKKEGKSSSMMMEMTTQSTSMTPNNSTATSTTASTFFANDDMMDEPSSLQTSRRSDHNVPDTNTITEFTEDSTAKELRESLNYDKTESDNLLSSSSSSSSASSTTPSSWILEDELLHSEDEAEWDYWISLADEEKRQTTTTTTTMEVNELLVEKKKTMDPIFMAILRWVADPEHDPLWEQEEQILELRRGIISSCTHDISMVLRITVKDKNNNNNKDRSTLRLALFQPKTVTKVRRVPRRTVLSDWYHELPRDLQDDEFDLLLKDMRLPSHKEEEYECEVGIDEGMVMVMQTIGDKLDPSHEMLCRLSRQTLLLPDDENRVSRLVPLSDDEADDDDDEVMDDALLKAASVPSTWSIAIADSESDDHHEDEDMLDNIIKEGNSHPSLSGVQPRNTNIQDLDLDGWEQDDDEPSSLLLDDEDVEIQSFGDRDESETPGRRNRLLPGRWIMNSFLARDSRRRIQRQRNTSPIISLKESQMVKLDGRRGKSRSTKILPDEASIKPRSSGPQLPIQLTEKQLQRRSEPPGLLPFDRDDENHASDEDDDDEILNPQDIAVLEYSMLEPLAANDNRGLEDDGIWLEDEQDDSRLDTEQDYNVSPDWIGEDEEEEDSSETELTSFVDESDVAARFLNKHKIRQYSEDRITESFGNTHSSVQGTSSSSSSSMGMIPPPPPRKEDKKNIAHESDYRSRRSQLPPPPSPPPSSSSSSSLIRRLRTVDHHISSPLQEKQRPPPPPPSRTFQSLDSVLAPPIPQKVRFPPPPPQQELGQHKPHPPPLERRKASSLSQGRSITRGWDLSERPQQQRIPPPPPPPLYHQQQ